MLRGVLHMHRCGVAHRDLKLDNLCVSSADGFVKWIDFGMAHVSSPPCAASTPADGGASRAPRAPATAGLREFCGSRSYMAGSHTRCTPTP